MKYKEYEMRKAECQHCNNETLMQIRDYNKKEVGSLLDDNYFYDTTIVLFCPICENYNLINAYWDNTYGKTADQEYNMFGGDLVNESHVYPMPSNLISQKSDLIPHDIINNFTRAINLKKYDEESCLIKLRKTLEMLCNNQNAEGNNLYEKISYLSEKNILPATLNSASTLTRKLGNIGAHEPNIEINSNELKIAIDLVEYIIEYIYVLPKEIELLGKKFKISESNI